MTKEMTKLISDYVTAKENLRSAKNAFRDVFNTEQSNFICSIIDEEGLRLALEQIDIISNPIFDVEQMKAIRLALKSELPNNIIRKIVNGNFDEDQVKSIIDSYPYLTPKELDFVSNHLHSAKKIRVITDTLRDGFKLEQIEFIDPAYNVEQFEVIIDALKNGVKPEQFDIFDPSINYKVMDIALKSLYKRSYRYPIDYIKLIANQTDVYEAHKLSYRDSFYNITIKRILDEFASEIDEEDKIDYDLKSCVWRIAYDLTIYIPTEYDINELKEKICIALPYIENIYVKEKDISCSLELIEIDDNLLKHKKKLSTKTNKPKCYDYIYNSHKLGPVKFCGDLYEVSICKAGIYEEEDYDYIQILLKEFGY